MAERSRDWIEQARNDLSHARHAATGGFYEWACFAAQQAAEKAVKAVLQRLGADAWGHSVADLLEGLAEKRPEVTDLREAALDLDKTYIPARYPDAHPSGSPKTRYTAAEAERMINHAERIAAQCEDLLARL